MLADLSESLYGIRVVTANNRQRRNIVNHRHVVGAYRDANIYTGRVDARSTARPPSSIGILGQGLLLGHRRRHGTCTTSSTLGALVAFFLYLNRFFAPIQLLVQQYNALQQGRSSIIRLRELLETAPSVDEADGAPDLAPHRGPHHLRARGLRLRRRHPRADTTSTSRSPRASRSRSSDRPARASRPMAKLANRFYDPTSGRVLLDGVDARAVTLHSLRSQLGVVPQEPFLFAGSIRDQPALRPPRRHRRAKSTRRSTSSACATWSSRLPDGLDTAVHERGQTLSAGERQLLALARAFLARPRVLILDEATSSLDLRSETVVERALDRLLEGRSAILIAHRLTTAQRADRIVVIDRGGVVEVGTPRELLAAGGPYARMYDAWLASGGRDATTTA